MTARICGRALNYPVVAARQAIDMALQGDDTHAVIQADIASPEVWMRLGLVNTAYLLASPPWSSAGSGQGLRSPEDRIFIDMLQQSSRGRMRVLICENVAGITRHPDFNAVTTEAALYGYKLVLSGVHDCSIIHPARRDRGLGTFGDSNIALSTAALLTANVITVGKSGAEAIARSPTVGAASVRHVNMSEDERKELNIPDEVMCMLRDRTFASLWIRGSLQDGQDVLDLQDQGFTATTLSYI